MKKHLPKSVMFYISLSILIIIFIALFYSVSIFIFEKKFNNRIYWLGFFSSIIGIIYFSYKALHLAKRSIVILEDRIQVQGDIGGRDIKLQYAFNVKFNDIQSIDITVDSNNSRDQYMRFVITPMPNIVLYLNNGKKERINMYYYSKKQTIEIIDQIIEKKRMINPTFTNRSGQELVKGLENAKI